MFQPGGSTMQLLSRNSFADDQPLIVSSDMMKPVNGKGKGIQEPIGTGGKASPTREKIIFTTDAAPGVCFPGHYMKIDNMPVQQLREITNDLHLRVSLPSLPIERTNMANCYAQIPFNVKVRGMCYQIQFKDVVEPKQCTVFVCFDDARHGDSAFPMLQMLNPNLKPSNISQLGYAAGLTHGRPIGDAYLEDTTRFEGQLILMVRHEGKKDYGSPLQSLEAKVYEFAVTFGEVLGFAEIEPELGIQQYRVEYFSITAAEQVLGSVDEGCPMHIGDVSSSPTSSYSENKLTLLRIGSSQRETSRRVSTPSRTPSKSRRRLRVTRMSRRTTTQSAESSFTARVRPAARPGASTKMAMRCLLLQRI